MSNRDYDYDRNREGDYDYDQERYGEGTRTRNWGERNWGQRQGGRWGQGRDFGTEGYNRDFGYRGHHGYEGRNRREEYGPGYYGESYTSQGAGYGSGYGEGFERSGGPSSPDYGYGYGYGNQPSHGWQGQNWRNRGRFSGMGPENYHRSDDRVREDINDRLTENPEIDASHINVQVSNGDVTLTGDVDDRWMKRMAEDVTDSVSGVKNVRNELKTGHAEHRNQAQQRQAA